MHENEVMRAYKTVNDSYIEPISFTVPRRAETFQSDIYPPAVGTKPAVSALEWLNGKTGLPPKIDLESIYEGNAPVEIASDYKHAPHPAPAQAQAQASKPAAKKEEPKPASPVVARAPPSTADQKASISAMADKYKADESSSEDDDDAETSSFEEIPKPAQRAAAPASASAAQPRPTPAAQPSSSSSFKTTPAPSSPVAAKHPEPAPQPKPTSSQTPAPAGSGSGSGSGLESTLETIKHLLEQQTRIISTQSERIGQLTTEVETLKKRVGNGAAAAPPPQDQSERIRQLELELEAARS